MQTTNAIVKRHRGKANAPDISGTVWGNWRADSRAGAYMGCSTWYCTNLTTGEKAIKDKDTLRRYKARLTSRTERSELESNGRTTA